MTQRLDAARAAMAHAIAFYVPTHIYAEACAALVAAATELEDAARVEDDRPAEPPVTLVDPAASLLDALPPVFSTPAATEPATTTDGPSAVPPPQEPNASSEPATEPALPSLTLADTHKPAEPIPADPLPTAAEAVADALAPYQVAPPPSVDVGDGSQAPKAKRKR